LTNPNNARGNKCIIINCSVFNNDIRYHRRFRNGLCHKHYVSELKQKHRLFLIALLGGKCIDTYNLHLPNDPFLTDIRSLQFDHKSGHGNKERHMSRAFYYYYTKHQYEFKLWFQLLCANCNWIKRNINGEYVK
jgi:hypothetical protein